MQRKLLRFVRFLYFLFNVQCVFSLDNEYEVFDVKGCIEATSFNVPDAISTTETVLNKEETADGKYLQHALAVLNSTIAETTSKSVLTQLNELSQHNRVQYEFSLVGEEGPAHSKTFQVQLKLGNEIYEAEGKSKKTARQLAATYALERTNYRTPPPATDEQSTNLITPTVQLNNIAQKLALKVTYANVDKSTLRRGRLGEHSYDGKPKSVLLKLNHTYDDEFLEAAQPDRFPFVYKVIVGEKEYYGIGNSVQDAKHEAAKSALDSMKKEALEELNFCANEGYEEECELKKLSLKSPISKIYELAQKLKLDVTFDIIKERGRDHKKVFVMECKLGDLSVTAEGTKKKEAKKAAAELMLERVHELPDVPEDYSVILQTKGKKNKKQKKNKVVQNLKTLGESAVNSLSSLWDYVPEINIGDNAVDVPVEKENEQNSDNDEQKPNHKPLSPQKETFKTDILHLTATYNIHIDYKDLGKKDNRFYSQLSLDTKPKYICFGRGDSTKQAEDVASLRGLRLLYKLGFIAKTVVVPKEVLEESSLAEDAEMLWVRTKPDEEENSS